LGNSNSCKIQVKGLLMTSHLLTPRPVLIIGAGIGGLSSAIILAKLGFDVTVIEKNREPGGMMRSHTREGIECSVGLHYLGSLGEGQVLRKFFDYLGLTTQIPVTRMGQDGIIDRYIFDSHGTHPATFDVPEGLEAFEKNLKQAFPDEQIQIDELLKLIRKATGQLHDLDYLYSVENDFSLLDQSIPLGEILDRLGCSPGLRSIMAVPSCWIGVPLNDCPAYYHNMALASYLSSSWRLKCSGSQSLVKRRKQFWSAHVTSKGFTWNQVYVWKPPLLSGLYIRKSYSKCFRMVPSDPPTGNAFPILRIPTALVVSMPGWMQMRTRRFRITFLRWKRMKTATFRI